MGIQSKTYKQFLGILDKYGFSKLNNIDRTVIDVKLLDTRDRKFTEFSVTARLTWDNADTDKSLKMISDLARVVCEREGIAFVGCGVLNNLMCVNLRFVSHASID